MHPCSQLLGDIEQGTHRLLSANATDHHGHVLDERKASSFQGDDPAPALKTREKREGDCRRVALDALMPAHSIEAQGLGLTSCHSPTDVSQLCEQKM